MAAVKGCAQDPQQGPNQQQRSFSVFGNMVSWASIYLLLPKLCVLVCECWGGGVCPAPRPRSAITEGAAREASPTGMDR